MRTFLIVIGVVIAGLGVAAVLGFLDISTQKEVISIGDFKASVEETKSIPQWAGIVAIVVGTALAVGGFARKR